MQVVVHPAGGIVEPMLLGEGQVPFVEGSKNRATTFGAEVEREKISCRLEGLS
jgi:hypothetical protein